jgi:hypothetical protein
MVFRPPVGPSDAFHIYQIRSDEHGGRDSGKNISIDISLHGSMHRPKIVCSSCDCHVFHGRRPLVRNMCLMAEPIAKAQPMSEVGRTAKNSRKTLTSELPQQQTWCGEETPFALLVPPRRCEPLPVRSLSAFWKKIAMGRVAIAHRRPGDVCTDIGCYPVRHPRLLTPVRMFAHRRGARRRAARGRCGYLSRVPEESRSRTPVRWSMVVSD